MLTIKDFDAGTAVWGQLPKITSKPEEVRSPSRRHVIDESARYRKTMDDNTRRLDELSAGRLSRDDQQSIANINRNNNSLQATIQANTVFMQSGRDLFGQAKMASGYRTVQVGTNSHVLDWAIAVPAPARKGVNNVRFQHYEHMGLS